MTSIARSTRLRRLAPAILIAAGAPIGLLAGPPAAQAAPYNCSQWGFSGHTDFQQSDGWVLSFNSTGPSAGGPVLAQDGHFPNTGPDKHGNVTGGVVNGQGIDIQVHWDNGTVSKYSGEVDPSGGVTGNVYVPAQDPSVTGRDMASYTSVRPLKCVTAAAPAPPPDPQVVLAPGAKDTPHDLKPQGLPAATSVQIKSGPTTLPAGMSGTYVVTVTNTSTDTKPVQVAIIFAGKLEQTGQINAQGGLNCVLGNDAGINAAVNCTGPIPQGSYDIVVQGRGSAPGAGQLIAKLDNDTKQQNVTIT
jgi:hypothetical protein